MPKVVSNNKTKYMKQSERPVYVYFYTLGATLYHRTKEPLGGKKKLYIFC